MPSVTSFTRPTSTAWWRSAAHFSAPWTGPSSMPSELGSLVGAHINPAPFIPTWLWAEWGWTLHRPLAALHERLVCRSHQTSEAELASSQKVLSD